MAIKYIIEHQFKKTDILFCADSKSVIQAIETDKKNYRGQIIAEIKLFQLNQQSATLCSESNTKENQNTYLYRTRRNSI